MTMRIHPRESIVSKAEMELFEKIFASGYKDSTYDEVIRGLSSALTRMIDEEKPSPDSDENIGDKIFGFVHSVSAEHGLTFGEIASIIGKHISSEAKYLIRVERHGNEDKPGGLA